MSTQSVSRGSSLATRANRWPGLDTTPTGPKNAVSSTIARRLFVAAINRQHVTVRVLGDRDRSVQTYGLGGPTMTIHRPREFFTRLGNDGLIGFGEAYLTEAWEAEDLGAFLSVLAAEMPRLVPQSLQKLRAAYVARPPALQRSTKENAQDNIAHHYDLSNDFFRLWLDETLTYSSALFLDSRDSLADAQGHKIERLLDQAKVGEGSRVLEIGTGWGELGIRAARRGATVHSITLSVEQKTLAEKRIADAGYADQVTVDLCDYRDVAGSYDAVVSIEMIEAVGYDFWQQYFEIIDTRLAPGGVAAIQAITMPHDRMLATRNTYTWINKYIFPGGFLPSVEVIDELTRTHTSLRMSDSFWMGQHYAETLRQWDESFTAAHDEVLAMGFDETFLRMWHFYLEYSRAGFASGYINVGQLVFERETA